MRIEPVYNFDCDVLVIGGGPAGSGLANHLAERGIDVLVVESQKFPRDKVCGDALSPLAVKELQLLGVADREPFKKANEIKTAAIFVNDEEIGDIDLPTAKGVDAYSKVIPRKILDNLIYEEAKKKGANFWEEHKLKSFEVLPHYVRAVVLNNGEEKTIKSRLIVGADGANSTVARIFHGAKPAQSERLFALRAYFEGINGPANQGQIYFKRDNFPGLYWLFPTSENTANIGLGMIAETLPRNQEKIKDLLTNQIANSPNLKARIGNGKMVGNIHGWPLSSYNPRKRIVGNRVLLLGDAAGFINALSGDGVQYALQTANWASNTIEDCVKNNNFSIQALQPFEEEIHKKLGLDFAFADIIVQAGRNKALELIAMRLLTVLLERSKKDRIYGSIIGGIFGGTYPSYHILSPVFVLKTIFQLALHTNEGLIDTIKEQNGLSKAANSTLEGLIDSLDIINDDLPSHVDWAKTLINKGIAVGTNVIQNNR